MASTVFTDNSTVIVSSWLNDVNTVTYTTVPANTTAIATKASSGANNDITSLTGLTTPLSVAQGGTAGITAAAARTNLSAAGSGTVTGSGITQSTNRLLGRTTPATGAIEEISVGTGLTFSAGSLSLTTPAGKTIAQVQTTVVTAVATGSTTTPADDTIPQVTEGNEFLTLAITPTNASSTLHIDVVWVGSNGTGSTTTMALHEVGVANALAATGMAISGTSLMTIPLKHVVSAGSTSARTYSIRVGSSAGSTITSNGVSAARYYGGVCSSRVTITEYLP